MNSFVVTLVQLTFDCYMIEAKPEKLIGDKPYDSDRLDAELKDEGVEMIVPRKKNCVLQKTQDGRVLRHYKCRWIIERFWSWLHWHRRLAVRREYYITNFPAFVQLATICILLKQF
ncbi:MAG TPA: transposase [Nitrospirota bacterium]|nr:transposase [Nitrospirota bacterium]